MTVPEGRKKHIRRGGANEVGSRHFALRIGVYVYPGTSNRAGVAGHTLARGHFPDMGTNQPGREMVNLSRATCDDFPAVRMAATREPWSYFMP